MYSMPAPWCSPADGQSLKVETTWDLEARPELSITFHRSSCLMDFSLQEFSQLKLFNKPVPCPGFLLLFLGQWDQSSMGSMMIIAREGWRTC